MKNKIVEFLENKKILILGFGREGKSAYKFITENTKNTEIGIADINNVNGLDNVKKHIGKNYLNYIEEYDVVIKSPGIILKDYVGKKNHITSLTDLFLRFCDNTIIGITGTKGKSTTSSLIHHILINNNKDSFLVGNIGLPCFDVIDKINKDSIIVYELSCHQLEYVKASPSISILLNVYQEHLDHYNGMNEYVQCKKNIYKYQTDNDYLIYGDVEKYISKEELNEISANKICIDSSNINVDLDNIETKLIGNHNKKNIVTAILATKLVGVEYNDALNSVKSFEPLEHRLELVGTYKGITFYNDSIATAQEAVMNAVSNLKNVNTIIIGGMDRGLDYQSLICFLCESTVENIILLPNTNERMMKIFDAIPNDKKLLFASDMEVAVKLSYQYTKKNKICLLSPAAASYGFYLNFEKRGEHFKELVRKYGNEGV